MVTATLTSDLDASATLCTSCGLCCDGMLHARATLKPGEAVHAAALGLPIEPGGNAFSLPCPKLVDRRCSIFEQRPSVCAGYKCDLLLNLEAGEIDINDALEIVNTAHRLILTCAYDKFHPAATTASTMEQTLHRTTMRLFIDNNFMSLNDIKMVKQEVIQQEKCE